MKNQTFYISLLGLMLLFAATSASAQIDLSAREALYFTGTKTDAIDLKKDIYAAKGSTLNLPADLAKSCDNTGCEFNIGMIGFRSGAETRAITSYALASLPDSTAAGNTLYFGSGEKVKQVVVPLKLKLGKNVVTVAVDPYMKTAESNETNNSFSVTVNVNGRPGEARKGKKEQQK